MALTNRGVGQLKDLATMVAEEPLSDAQVEGDMTLPCDTNNEKRQTQ